MRKKSTVFQAANQFPYGFLLTYASKSEPMRLNASTTICKIATGKPFCKSNKKTNANAIRANAIVFTTRVKINDLLEGSCPCACERSFIPLKINIGTETIIPDRERRIKISANTAKNAFPIPSDSSPFALSNCNKSPQKVAIITYTAIPNVIAAVTKCKIAANKDFLLTIIPIIAPLSALICF